MMVARDVDVRVQRGRVVAKVSQVIPGTPEDIWTLLACEESKALFRVESRQQLSSEGAVTTEQVVFLAAVRIMFWKRWARTTVHQVIDFTNPQDASVTFRLLQSSMMSHLSGSWRLRQVRPAADGGGEGEDEGAATQVTYSFKMWPKGVPVALRFMPGLVDAVKAAVAREAGQLFDKLAYVAGKVAPDGSNLLAAAEAASADIERAGGSFKCLQALQRGDAAAAAAAAAAEAAARQQLAQELLEQQQQAQQQHEVVGHALDFSSSDEGDDEEEGGEAADSEEGSLAPSGATEQDLAGCEEASALTVSSSSSSDEDSDGEQAGDGLAAAAAAGDLAALLRLSDSGSSSSGGGGGGSSGGGSQPGTPEASATITFASVHGKAAAGKAAAAAAPAAGAVLTPAGAAC